MKTNLDIWAIQYYPECLKTALDNIKYGSKVFLFRNCVCKFSVGINEITTRQFDTVLYSDESDLLVMLMKDGNAKDSQIIEYLNKRNIPFEERNLGAKLNDYQDGDNIPELWFIRETYVLQDAIKESKNRKIKVAKFYKNTESVLTLTGLENKELIRIEGKGIVQLEDKVCIIINHGFEKNMIEEEVKKCIEDFDLEYEEIQEKSPNLKIENFSKKIEKFQKN